MLGQNHAQDTPAGVANRFQDADFAPPLQHRQRDGIGDQRQPRKHRQRRDQLDDLYDVIQYRVDLIDRRRIPQRNDARNSLLDSL